MPGLTVTEKEFWKERLAARIGKRIEAIKTEHPALFDRVKREAHTRALKSLGIAGHYAELEAIQAEEVALARRENAAQKAMLAQLRGVPPEEIGDGFSLRYGGVLPLPHEAAEAIARRQAAHKDRLLADDPVGREIARWEAERESLLDTVWLATSPAQIKQLWAKVGELLGDEPTRLEGEALAIEAGREV